MNSNTSILVVDDIPENLQLLTEILDESGYNIQIADNGSRALEILEISKPDLILLDISMPDITGYEVCQKIKMNPQLEDIPVIFLSAFNEVEHIVEAFDAGGVDYITKPFNPREVLARVSTHLQLTAQKKKIEEQYEQLKSYEKLRDGLVHMIIHDLRSPLSTISLTTEYLNDLDLSEITTDILKEVTSDLSLSTDMINNMISDLLDVNKLESNKLILQKEPHDLFATLGEVSHLFEIALKQKGISLDLEGEHATVVVDVPLITRVINNLLTNALKYTPQNGSITLKTYKEEMTIRVEISDSGKGIPKEYQSMIFEKFGQVKNAEAKHSSGLGLTFCKLAVEAHDGQIGVRSESGEGSTFWFTLPVS